MEYFIDLQPDTFSDGLWTLFVVALVFMVVIAGGRDIANSFLERLKAPLLYLFLVAVAFWVLDARRAGTEGVLIGGDAITLTVDPSAGSTEQSNSIDSFNSNSLLAPATGANTPPPDTFTHTHDGSTHSHAHG